MVGGQSADICAERGGLPDEDPKKVLAFIDENKTGALIESSLMIGAILGGLIGLYGGYLFIHTYERDKYDIDYEFTDKGMTVKHRWGVTEYSYEDIVDATLIVPENEYAYSLIHVKTKKHKYLIPFTGKKELCDQIYALLTTHVTLRDLNEEIEKAKKNAQQ